MYRALEQTSKYLLSFEAHSRHVQSTYNTVVKTFCPTRKTNYPKMKRTKLQPAAAALLTYKAGLFGNKV